MILSLSRNLLLLLFLLAIVAWIWVPHDITTFSIQNQFQPISLTHLLGTDHFGRDLLSMLMLGAGTTIASSVLAVAIGMVIGIPLGLIASYTFNKPADIVLSFSQNLVFAFPVLLTAILFAGAFGPSALSTILAVGIFHIPVFYRLSRSAALPLWNREHVTAAFVIGKRPIAIGWKHVLPHVWPIIQVQASFQLCFAIFAEVNLSYLGLGVQPPRTSWGSLIADNQVYLFTHPHLSFIPGVAMIIFTSLLLIYGHSLQKKRWHRHGNFASKIMH